MNFLPYLSTVIVVATMATVVLAIFSYAAFKLRDRRKPQEELTAEAFFSRYSPPASDSVGTQTSSDQDGGRVD